MDFHTTSAELCTYVSFYTPKYAEAAGRLTRSLKRFSLKHEVLPMSDAGEWTENCAKKAGFCLEMWSQSSGPIVWVDADAVVREYPILFDEIDADVACHFRNDRRYKNECLSGTVYFNNTPGALRILTRWKDLSDKRENEWDQRILQEVLETEENYSLYRLPASYTQIYDTMADRGPAVIEHFQRSRDVR